MLLGDAIHEALRSVGVTSERVERWLGKPCNCPDRQLKLNYLHQWALKTLDGGFTKAKDYLHELLDAIPDSTNN